MDCRNDKRNVELRGFNLLDFYSDGFESYRVLEEGFDNLQAFLYNQGLFESS